MKSSRAVFLLSIMLSICARPAPAQTPPSQDQIDRRAESILGKMTLEEKIDYISGVDGFYIRAIPRLGLPRLRMADGPIGVRNFGPATAYAAGIGLAATWNPALAERVGIELGRDARAKGVHFLLAPGVNIYRAPLNGRNFEYFGEDPFLAARIAVAYIKGVQAQGVSATIKHFIANNSEFDRHKSDAIIDERTLREIYLPVFEAGVKEGGVGAIMDAYNLVNGAHLSANGYLNTDVAKKDWGFRGVVMSDWVSTYDAVAAANGGLDLEMPSGAFMNRANLLPAIEQGKVKVATIDDKVRRILRLAIRFGWLDREQRDLSVPRFNTAGRQAALDAAREALVLLKNDDDLLPLDESKVKSVAIIGPDAYPAIPAAGGSAAVEPFTSVSLVEGLTRVLGPNVEIFYHPGIATPAEIAQATPFVRSAGGDPGLEVEVFGNATFTGAPVETRVDEHVNFSPQTPSSQVTLQVARAYSSRWSGFFMADSASDFEVFAETTRERDSGIRLFVDDKLVIDGGSRADALLRDVVLPLSAGPHKIVLEQFRPRAIGGHKIRFGIAKRGTLVDAAAKELAAKADVVVAAVGFDTDTESEGADRRFDLPLGQDELIRELAAANKRTVVAMTSGGGVDMRPWLASVPALIEIWYPGQEGGIAFAEALVGKVDPSGRLPVTFERKWEDNPVFASYYPQAAGSDRVEYREGVFVGYRGYERNGTEPQFPFGYGLSYTTFEYSDLEVKSAGAGRYDVAFDVQNTGSRAGSDVAQVYVGAAPAAVPRPAKELKGLAKVKLAPGEKQRVTVALDSRSFSYYDADRKKWAAVNGKYPILVGRSSQQIELTGEVVLGR